MENNNLPQYWVVKNDGSQLFKDTVISYINYVYNQKWSGSNLYYIGFDGYSNLNDGINIHYEIEEFKNNPILLTIKQFIKLSNLNSNSEISNKIDILNFIKKCFDNNIYYSRFDNCIEGEENFIQEIKEKLLCDISEENKNKPYIKTYKLVVENVYNKDYGDNRICKCGHKYYRHFDSYENNLACGCKYCNCYRFEEKEC